MNADGRPLPAAIPALMPRGDGHQFLFYGDSCSGVPGAPHAETFARVNAVVSRLRPEPEFVVFPGDEIVGLTTDETALRAQWRHWLEVEMAWLDRTRIPLYNTTSNHTTYDEMSERVFADVLSDLPRNGPSGQEGLSYFVRRGTLLLVFVHTSATALGGEGHLETDWLETTLAAHADARFKVVVGHHPVFPVNGYQAPYQREIGPEYAERFWRLLVENDVLAYLCSHILAFDVQVHDGVLQVCSAGAGTAHRMPEGFEYLHGVQMALDNEGLRYQVLDTDGIVREVLSWPPALPPSKDWPPVAGINSSHFSPAPRLQVWRISGRTAAENSGIPQTLLSAVPADTGLSPFWIGLTGATNRLTIYLSPETGRSPHYWFGPELATDAVFDIEVAAHPGMGPGGLLWRRTGDPRWSSLDGASAWGTDRLVPPARWTVGHGPVGEPDQPFRGRDLKVGEYVDLNDFSAPNTLPQANHRDTVTDRKPQPQRDRR